MTPQLKTVDGTGNDKLAPPPKKGLALAVYNTIDAMAGEATQHEIEALLPAEITESHQIGRKRIYNSLHYLKNYGYVVHNPGSDKWRIAPLSYFKAREQWRNDPDREPKYRAPRRKKADRLDLSEKVVYRHDWMYTALFATTAFAVGVFIGINL